MQDSFIRVASWPVSTDRIPLSVIGTGANTRSKHIERSALSGSSRPPTPLAAGIGFRTEVPTLRHSRSCAVRHTWSVRDSLGNAKRGRQSVTHTQCVTHASSLKSPKAVIPLMRIREAIALPLQIATG